MKKRQTSGFARGPEFRAAKILARIVGVCSRSALKYILRHRIITSVPRLCKCLIAKEPANGKKLQRWRQIKSHTPAVSSLQKRSAAGVAALRTPTTFP